VESHVYAEFIASDVRMVTCELDREECQSREYPELMQLEVEYYAMRDTQ
jgi:hypothetical protein